jgi:hypothetical protein
MYDYLEQSSFHWYEKNFALDGIVIFACFLLLGCYSIMFLELIYFTQYLYACILSIKVKLTPQAIELGILLCPDSLYIQPLANSV